MAWLAEAALGAVTCMRWRRPVLGHWSLTDPGPLRDALPPGLTLDLHEGRAWVTLAAVEVTGPAPALVTRTRLGGAITYLQVALRTYARGPLGPGLVMLETRVDRARALVPRLGGLPYVLDPDLAIRLDDGVVEVTHGGEVVRGEVLGGSPEFATPGSLDAFLLERYWLYGDAPGLGPYGVRVAHRPWRVAPARLRSPTLGLTARAHVSPPLDVRVVELARVPLDEAAALGVSPQDLLALSEEAAHAAATRGVSAG